MWRNVAVEQIATNIFPVANIHQSILDFKKLYQIIMTFLDPICFLSIHNLSTGMNNVWFHLGPFRQVNQIWVYYTKIKYILEVVLMKLIYENSTRSREMWSGEIQIFLTQVLIHLFLCWHETKTLRKNVSEWVSVTKIPLTVDSKAITVKALKH